MNTKYEQELEAHDQCWELSPLYEGFQNKSTLHHPVKQVSDIHDLPKRYIQLNVTLRKHQCLHNPLACGKIVMRFAVDSQRFHTGNQLAPS